VCVYAVVQVLNYSGYLHTTTPSSSTMTASTSSGGGSATPAKALDDCIFKCLK